MQIHFQRLSLLLIIQSNIDPIFVVSEFSPYEDLVAKFVLAGTKPATSNLAKIPNAQ